MTLQVDPVFDATVSSIDLPGAAADRSWAGQGALWMQDVPAVSTSANTAEKFDFCQGGFGLTFVENLYVSIGCSTIFDWARGLSFWGQCPSQLPRAKSHLRPFRTAVARGFIHLSRRRMSRSTSPHFSTREVFA